MRPAIATVVTAGTWERDLVALARSGAAVRVVRRCHTAADVERVIGRIDVLVVGAETAWLSQPIIHRWRSRGVAVLGMVASNDRPGRQILHAGGANEILVHTQPPAHLIASIASIAHVENPPLSVAPMATVVGPRGSPGGSEISLAVAWAVGRRCRTLLAEMDAEAPGLGIRLGLSPGAGLAASDPAVSSQPIYRRFEPIELVTLPPRTGPMSRSLATRVIELARKEFTGVVVDAGPISPHLLGFDPGRTVLVVHPSPSGLVRAGRMIAEWEGAAPLVVANRVPAGLEGERALKLVRAATGLEPMAVVPQLHDITSRAPSATMVRELEPIARALFGIGQRSAAR